MFSLPQAYPDQDEPHRWLLRQIETHVNETYAKNTAFKTRIAHGMLSAGMISNLLGSQLPGPGTIYMQQGKG